MSPLDRPPIGPEFTDAVEHNPPPRRTRNSTPTSIRLTPEEKAALKREAGSTPLGAYIRSKLLGDAASYSRRRSRRPVRDDRALAKLLSELGTSRLSQNLNQLARAANTGSLQVTPDTEKALQQACRDVAWMRATLLKALGQSAGPS